ncbi:MAG: protein-export chaperone SecB [Lachnospiraceae bacterium]|jgi:preprotein translocase subunit SecB
MANNSVSSLKFVNYVVDRVEFYNNPEFEADEVSIKFDIRPEYIEEDGDLMLILDVDVFKNAVANNYPFELFVKMIGYFKLEGDGDINRYRNNALAIMYPYIRSLVTGYTANSNVTPLILPVINVNAMFNKDKK